MKFTIREITPVDCDLWADMRCALWPQDTRAQHLAEIDRVFAAGDLNVFVAETADAQPAGFAEVSFRPYANGCEERPAPFLEGIWVAQQRRRQGVGKLLIDHIRAFLTARGHGELGSDVLLENAESQAAHAAWGFAEVERVICYRKVL